MFSWIKRLLKGFKVYFGSEFRYYTIVFFFFLILTAILAPLFILLNVKTPLKDIELVYVIGSSSAIIYLVYIFLTMNRQVRKVFFQTKWKYFFAILVPIGGTIGLSFLFLFLIGVIPNVLEYIVTFTLFGSFFIWLIVQLFTFGLFIRDLGNDFIEKIEKHEETKNKRFIIFSLILLGGMIIYLFAFRFGFLDITDTINTHFINVDPFNLWWLPLAVTVLSGIVLIISLIRKRYQNTFFSTFYILLYNVYLLYHLVYLLVYVYDSKGTFVRAINLLSLVFFTFTVIYALQSTGALIKTKLEKWWQSISFFLFAIALLYVTWSVTFLYNLADQGIVEPEALNVIFWGINHLFSYMLGILLLIVTVFIFLPGKKRKKEIE